MRHIVQHTFPAAANNPVVQDRAMEDVKVPLFPCTAKYEIHVIAITKKKKKESIKIPTLAC